MKMKMIADPPIWIIDDNSGKIWCFSMPEPNSDGKVTFQIPTKKCHYEFEFSSFFSGCFLETWKRYGIVPSSNVESLQIWCSQDSESGSLLGLGTCSAACCSQMKRLCSLCCSSNLQKNAGPRLTQRIPSARSGNTWLKILEIWCNLIACLEHLHFFGGKKHTVFSRFSFFMNAMFALLVVSPIWSSTITSPWLWEDQPWIQITLKNSLFCTAQVTMFFWLQPLTHPALTCFN